MAYPPLPHRECDPVKIEALIRAHPFAHLFSGEGFSGEGQAMRVTRLPFAADFEADELKLLRAHMSGANPQCQVLDGAEALIAFSGPDSYVSPNWRTASDRGATWDYQAVHVWGRVRVRDERPFFDQLINDLAASAEARFQGVSQKPDWSISSVSEAYIERLRPRLCAFEIRVSRVEAIAKLHQDFPDEDARSVSEHLLRSAHDNSRKVGALIEGRLQK